MRRTAWAAVGAALVVLAGPACRPGTSENAEFCQAVRNTTLQIAAILASGVADDAPQRAPREVDEFRAELDRLDATAPPEVEADVRTLTNAYRTFLDTGRAVDPSAAGRRVQAWAQEHCEAGVPSDSPYPRPSPPPPPPAPPPPPGPPTSPPPPPGH